LSSRNKIAIPNPRVKISGYRYIRIYPDIFWMYSDISGYRYIRIHPGCIRIYPECIWIYLDISISGYFDSFVLPLTLSWVGYGKYILDVSGCIWMYPDLTRIYPDTSISGYIWIYLDIYRIPRLGGS
jgi:hypothetical protein